MGFAQRKRDKNEPQIIAALTAMGAVVNRIMGCMGGDYGVPDLCVGFRGRTYMIEVKEPGTKAHTARSAKGKRAKGNDGPPENAKGQLTPTQVEWWKNWTGGESYVVETPEDAVRLVRGEDLPPEVRVSTCPDDFRADGAHRVVLAFPESGWMTPGQADALAGALHEQAGVARALAARMSICGTVTCSPDRPMRTCQLPPGHRGGCEGEL
jgi:hypothetical protein